MITETEIDEGIHIAIIRDVDLWEESLVLFPHFMNINKDKHIGYELRVRRPAFFFTTFSYYYKISLNSSIITMLIGSI